MDESRAGIDYEHANAARMYDFMLGGAHNFAVDREQVAKVLALRPDGTAAARAMRAYLARVVTFCVQDRGIDQFLDLGSGIPTVGNVHEVAHAHNPAARVAYVDFEPVAIAHATDILADIATATATRADLRDPDSVLQAPGVAGLLDLERPVALLALGVLHFVPTGAAELMAHYRDAVAPGSVLAINHGSHDQDDPELVARITGAAQGYQGSATEATLRTRAEIRELLAGTTLVPPGLVDITDWPHPTPDTVPAAIYGAVADID